MKQILKQYMRDKLWNFKSRNIVNPSLPENPDSFLFICLGNLCRSPFAEYRSLAMANSSRVSFSSAGLQVIHSNPPPEEAFKAAADFGIDLSSHKSREVELNDVSSADMILLMEHSHLRELQNRFPGYKDRMFLLPLFDNQAGRETSGYSRFNIPDPYGRGIQAFEDCFRRIDRCLTDLFKSLSFLD